MHPDFWHERWSDGRIGFHSDTVNGALERWWPELDIPADASVLVPLAGKTVDLAWLAARGHPTTGVELSQSAVEAWFGERELTPSRSQSGALEAWEGAGVRLLCGDIFDTTAGQIAATAWYDRAATVALPPQMRRRYVAHLASLLPAGAKGLLVTFDYPQSERNGPPFAIDAAEATALYSDHFALQHLHREPMMNAEGEAFVWGLSRAHRDVWALTRKG